MIRRSLPLMASPGRAGGDLGNQAQPGALTVNLDSGMLGELGLDVMHIVDRRDAAKIIIGVASPTYVRPRVGETGREPAGIQLGSRGVD
jgi:hypothetical protein